MTGPRERQRYAEDPAYRARRLAKNLTWRTANREKVNAERRRRYATDPEYRAKVLGTKEARRERKLQSKYGLSLQDYDRMVERQRGLCAMCWKRKRPLCVDHSHDLRMVRGLLCRHCNIGFGHFFEDPAFMRRAADYGDFFIAHQKEILRGDPAVLREAARLKEKLLSIDMSSLLPPQARAGRGSGARAKPPPRKTTARTVTPTTIVQPAKPERKKKHARQGGRRRPQRDQGGGK
jgi:hypothetical protein